MKWTIRFNSSLGCCLLALLVCKLCGEFSLHPSPRKSVKKTNIEYETSSSASYNIFLKINLSLNQEWNFLCCLNVNMCNVKSWNVEWYVSKHFQMINISVVLYFGVWWFHFINMSSIYINLEWDDDEIEIVRGN